jgi:photosystem II stability/assembly factor-like uncharacterized protein
LFFRNVFIVVTSYYTKRSIIQKMGKKRAQASMEFLMTYGWVIMITLIAIGALSYFGILNPDKFIPKRCALEPGLGCIDFKVNENSVTVIIRSGKGEDITINDIKVRDCTGTASGTLNNGEEKTYTISGCTNAIKNKFISDINITYTGETELTRKTRGNLVGKVQPGTTDTSSQTDETIVISDTSIDLTSETGLGTSITALDTNSIYVSYHANNVEDLKLAKSSNQGVSWTYSTIDSTGNVGEYNSIDAIDSNTLFVSYAGNGLKFAKSIDAGNNWDIKTVDGVTSIYTSIQAIDANTIFISYSDLDNKDLKFAKSVDGGDTWEMVIVDSTVNPRTTSLHALYSNTIFISYFDSTNNDLKFAKSVDGGDSWSTSKVDSLGIVGLYNSLHAVDANTIYISYRDHTGKDLKFAKSIDGGDTWATSIADGDGNVGEFTSIYALDTNIIYISYYDTFFSDNVLKFAKSIDGGDSWSIITADSEIGTGPYSSLYAVDHNNIYISYHGTLNKNLKFVRLGSIS